MLLEKVLIADVAGPYARELYTKTHIALAALVPVAVLGDDASLLMRVTDLSLGVVIPVHSHIAANAVITDYAPKYALGASRWGVLASSLVALVGLTKLNLQGAEKRLPPAVPIHSAFAAECGNYFIWQTIGLIHSFRQSGQPGPLTRLISCTDADWEAHPIKSIVATHRAPSFSVNPHNGDQYSAYNKPAAVIDWLQHVDVKEDYVFIFDTDMLLRRPFLPYQMNVHPGHAASAAYWYMDGNTNELALRHIPEIAPRNDTLAGPYGRRGDQVSGWFVMTTPDLKRVAPLWLTYSEDVRLDPEAWHLTNDLTVEKGGRPWISEMYGFSFGSAKAGVTYEWHRTAMIYPRDYPEENPWLLHYGLDCNIEVNGSSVYRWDKPWYRDFDALQCPPWALTGHVSQGGLFPHPPLASSLRKRPNEWFKEVLIVETIVTMNAAFCERHLRECPASEELSRECKKVREQAADLAQVLQEFQAPDALCKDFQPQCEQWKREGQCESNAATTKYECRVTCQYCDPATGHVLTERGQYY